MITEYELYSDERYEGHNKLLPGGLVVTDSGRERIATDPFPRFYCLIVDLSTGAWKQFRRSGGRGPKRDAKLASVLYQFLLVTFGPLRDTKRWWVYPDAGFS